MTKSEIEKKKKRGQLLFLLISIVFIIVFVFKFSELSNTVELLMSGSVFFLLCVIALQVLSIINRGALYHSVYDYFGARDTLRRLTYLSLSSNFINLVAPAGGLSGMTIFISEAEDQGMSKSRAIFVNIFIYFLIYSVFIAALLFGLFYLFFNHQLQKYIIITAAILFGMIVVILFAAIIAFEGASRVKNVIGFIAKLVNSVAGFLQRRKIIISNTDVHVVSEEVHECIKILKRKSKGLFLPVLHVFLLEAIDVITLYYLFLSFGYPVYPGVLITLYSVGVLFSLVSITPSGLGIVEATMILVAAGLGIPVELASVVVIGYRLVTFWLPFLLGYYSFRKMQKEKIIHLENGSA
ncbi:MAG: hypothetical protein BWY43_00266 [candidate division WS2 bacterium ADurb.Bin280]|uniref:Phosphatidylglycerol lysyltransferase n=1 Tax=candidate division WS2 bacterium ADurb.Bin280 TaxID=1852829 RepID=A0A1V5SEQ0_9BACT|nr:MAG: hypothetical protein BWY43_00266 [candidate division WS2 bacterium ADurb.Bin280]